MFKKWQQASSVMFFSRWSRKSYAIFVSLSKAVIICQLSIDGYLICLVKIQALARLFIHFPLEIQNRKCILNPELTKHSDVRSVLAIDLLQKKFWIEKINNFTNHKSPYIAQAMYGLFYFN